jgi:hypothetical protein
MTADPRSQPNQGHQTRRRSAKVLSRYLLASGLIPVCARCSRLRRNEGSLIWDQVAPEQTARLQNLTHGMCPQCQAILYLGLPSLRRSLTSFLGTAGITALPSRERKHLEFQRCGAATVNRPARQPTKRSTDL